MVKFPRKLIDLIMPIMERLTPTCEVISKKISQSMDSPPSIKDRLDIRIHTLGCVLCERYRQQLITMRQLVNKYTKENDEADPEQEMRLSEEAKIRLTEIVKQEKEK